MLSVSLQSAKLLVLASRSQMALILFNTRSFSIKALSWCAPDSTRNQKSAPKATSDFGNNEDKQSDWELEPIEKFGICAACDRSSRIMGINGQLPWNIPKDRKNFMDLTRDKLLVMGRKTYEERPNSTHISHAHRTIVVSTTMDKPSDDDTVTVTRSLSEALHMAKLVIEETESMQSREGLACWVVGGERIFDETLKHRSAEEIHLTLVDANVDIRAIFTKDEPSPDVAFFPAKYRWDRHYFETSRETTDADGDIPSFTTVVYRRRRSGAKSRPE